MTRLSDSDKILFYGWMKDTEHVSSQNVGAHPCGRPVGQAQGLPLPRVIEKIPAHGDAATVKKTDAVLRNRVGLNVSRRTMQHISAPFAQRFPGSDPFSLRVG